MFEVFRYARGVSRTDSQLYEDSADLHKFFIQTRDLLCKNGEVLLTPALSYQEVHLLRDLEVGMVDVNRLTWAEKEKAKGRKEKTQPLDPGSSQHGTRQRWTS